MVDPLGHRNGKAGRPSRVAGFSGSGHSAGNAHKAFRWLAVEEVPNPG